jgi:serine/threonine protein kinase
MFSVGVILFFLLAGYHPFNVDGQCTHEEIESSICSGSWRFDHETWSWVDPSSKNVVVSLLEVDPLKRITADQLLRQKWIKGSRCSALKNRRITSYRDYGWANDGGNRCPKRKSDEISSIGLGSDAVGKFSITIAAQASKLEEDSMVEATMTRKKRVRNRRLSLLRVKRFSTVTI